MDVGKSRTLAYVSYVKLEVLERGALLKHLREVRVCVGMQLNLGAHACECGRCPPS